METGESLRKFYVKFLRVEAKPSIQDGNHNFRVPPYGQMEAWLHYIRTVSDAIRQYSLRQPANSH